MENDIVRMLFLRRQRQKKRWRIKTISGAPPLSFKAKAGALKDYRIYGNTANGESVGDRTGNLFYKKIENANIASNDGRIYSTESFDLWIGKVKAGETYTSYNTNAIVGFFTDEPDYGAYTYDNSRITNATSVFTFTVPNGCFYVAMRFLKHETTIMLNEGSTPLPYEPYGYKVPVTISNGTDSQTIPIYLSEQIRKVGDEAEYIDYGQQKQHFADGTETDVTLPALPTLAGTNVLTVGTAVQPSGVEITGRIKKGE